MQNNKGWFKKGHVGYKATLGRKHTPLEKQKISEAAKGRTTWMKGKKHSQESRKLISLHARHYQSEETRRKIGEANKGEKCNFWKGGITQQSRLARQSLEYKLWRKQVWERDDYTCQICGIRGGIIEANHIKKFANYPELRFEIDNGVTLCKSCHFGWVNNHESEWESYFNFNLEARIK